MSDLINGYYNKLIDLLTEIRDAQGEEVEKTADAIADRVVAGARIFAFGASHSSLPVQDIVYRAGGLMLINPLFAPGIEALNTRPTTLGSKMEQMTGYAEVLLDNSPLREGDVLIVVSVSGRNAVPVELAREARARGILVIALTSEKYTSAVDSRVPDGTKLKDHADFLLDNHVDAGDAVLELDGVPQKFTPASGVTSTAILQSLSASIIEHLVQRGEQPPVFLAANLDGGAEWNAEHMERNRDRIFYLN
ncbi:MAG: SIS domain-containing protein [Corynebacterium sp.]|uniref:SIS domain-containing protein n=1 Tax=Corynebacterium sp. TaxID=1720 RepID=UPI0026476349|nr:SIS domain-containing protein [Corynebacterium sp.]MDN6281721.1 SIS domain-containing protein [Corynebacterium sp.]MDN6304209.1 SIS domain-containing protein [Corynebacterium sp.]MDN6351772.1 SIS domain-containing protein [Corynebacterium sp.]MDN6367506.1 SIS domain-containing protein [Corynebacterium sp.]MDN6374711.1 SIS domain-containing protein [Corynebacterium sp.]